MQLPSAILGGALPRQEFATPAPLYPCPMLPSAPAMAQQARHPIPGLEISPHPMLGMFGTQQPTSAASASTGQMPHHVQQSICDRLSLVEGRAATAMATCSSMAGTLDKVVFDLHRKGGPSEAQAAQSTSELRQEMQAMTADVNKQLFEAQAERQRLDNNLEVCMHECSQHSTLAHELFGAQNSISELKQELADMKELLATLHPPPGVASEVSGRYSRERPSTYGASGAA